jgi:hypothetical protein
MSGANTDIVVISGVPPPLRKARTRTRTSKTLPGFGRRAPRITYFGAIHGLLKINKKARPNWPGLFMFTVQVLMVGEPGFEPGASSSRTKRATKLRHSPKKARRLIIRLGPPRFRYTSADFPDIGTSVPTSGCLRESLEHYGWNDRLRVFAPCHA